MAETLLSASTILIYGRVLEDLTLAPVDYDAGSTATSTAVPHGGHNRFLQEQLASGEASLARVYGFAYEGHYYDLARPAIFLVHGPGEDPDPFPPGTQPPFDRLSRAPGFVERTGIALQPPGLAGDLRVWAYDKADLSLRLEVETGSLDQILLDAELRAEHLGAAYSGQNIRMSGQNVRMSGQNIRMSGQNVRLSPRRGSDD